jgi:hypothetical protein
VLAGRNGRKGEGGGREDVGDRTVHPATNRNCLNFFINTKKKRTDHHDIQSARRPLTPRPADCDGHDPPSLAESSENKEGNAKVAPSLLVRAANGEQANDKGGADVLHKGSG